MDWEGEGVGKGRGGLGGKERKEIGREGEGEKEGLYWGEKRERVHYFKVL